MRESPRFCNAGPARSPFTFSCTRARLPAMWELLSPSPQAKLSTNIGPPVSSRHSWAAEPSLAASVGPSVACGGAAASSEADADKKPNREPDAAAGVCVASVSGGAGASVWAAAEKSFSRDPLSAATGSDPNFSALRPKKVTPRRPAGRPSKNGNSSSMPCPAMAGADTSRRGARRDRAVSREKAHMATSVEAWRPYSLACRADACDGSNLAPALLPHTPRAAQRWTDTGRLGNGRTMPALHSGAGLPRACCSRRSETSAASSNSQRSSMARVSSGPRAEPRLPLNCFDDPTCLASGRSRTASSSRPEAIRTAAAAASSGCAHSPRRSLAAAPAPARRSSPAVPKPLSPSSGLPSRSSEPSLPPKPRSRSMGSGSSSAVTALAGRIVCWFGLCRPPLSLASSLLAAMPALQVKPSSRVTAARARATMAAAAANSISSSFHSGAVRAHHLAEVKPMRRTTCPECPARKELRASTPVGCAPIAASSSPSAAPATWVPAASASRSSSP
eukprot:scaffold11724_cov124-Isochrysis_galbana.AAC.12